LAFVAGSIKNRSYLPNNAFSIGLGRGDRRTVCSLHSAVRGSRSVRLTERSDQEELSPEHSAGRGGRKPHELLYPSCHVEPTVYLYFLFLLLSLICSSGSAFCVIATFLRVSGGCTHKASLGPKCLNLNFEIIRVKSFYSSPEKIEVELYKFLGLIKKLGLPYV
jgi:hypothetical protein